MSKVREHIVIEPSAGSIDFLRKDFDTSQVWFQHPRPQWITNLLPSAIAEACGGSNMTYSVWRRFPLRSPADFTIPSNEGAFLIRVYMPIGGSFDPTMWTCLTWHDAHRPPVVSSEKFHITGKGLQRILAKTLAAPEAIDALRTLDRRPRYECWVRHDWRALDIAPGCIDLPKWMSQVDGLSPAEAAAKMAALRAPTSNAEYFRIKAQDRAERQRKAKEEALALYAGDAEASQAAEPAAAATARPGSASPASRHA